MPYFRPARLALALILVALASKYPLAADVVTGNFTGFLAVAINVVMVAWMYEIIHIQTKGIGTRRVALKRVLAGFLILAYVWSYGWRYDEDLSRVFLLLDIYLFPSSLVWMAYGGILCAFMRFIHPIASLENPGIPLQVHPPESDPRATSDKDAASSRGN